MNKAGEYVDPFTQFKVKFMNALIAHPGIRRIFSLGNIVDTDTKRRRDNVMAADLPELALRNMGGQIQIFATSDSCVCMRRFSLVVATDSIKEEDELFAVQWEVLRALGSTAKNFDLKCVIMYSLEQYADTPAENADEENDRGSGGWLSVFDVIVKFGFSHKDDLQAQVPALAGGR